VATLKYLGRLVRNKNYFHKEIKGRSNPGNASQFSSEYSVFPYPVCKHKD
jgi:hypothetical protein